MICIGAVMQANDPVDLFLLPGNCFIFLFLGRSVLLNSITVMFGNWKPKVQ